MSTKRIEYPQRWLEKGEIPLLLKAITKPCCANCRYWLIRRRPKLLPFTVEINENETIAQSMWEWFSLEDAESQVEWQNTCQRYPPMLVHPIPEIDVEYYDAFGWPCTDWSDWCGEYQPRADEGNA